MAYILGRALLQPAAAPAVPREGAFDRTFLVKVVLTLVPPLTLIFLVLGSIIAGIATVNQAGAIGAAGALLMAGYRLREGQPGAYHPALLGLVSLLLIGIVLASFDTNIKNVATDAQRFGIALGLIGVAGLIAALIWSGIRAHRIDTTLHGVMVETAKTTSLVFIILLGAAMLTAAFRAFGGEDIVREFLNGLPGGFWSKFIIVMAVIFLLGFFLDFIEIAVVVVPIVAPILLADPSANITAVWLGVMIGLNIQTSFLTPPFGFALFYLRGVAPPDVRTIDMYKGVVPFIVLQLTALAIVGYIPQLVNYLPSRISFTSETAPPPRNPKLQYCLQNYVADIYAEDGDRIARTIAAAQAVDLGDLPKKRYATAAQAFQNAAATQSLLNQAFVAQAAVEAAAYSYRLLHRQVRFIESEMRELQKEIQALQTRLSHTRGADSAPVKAQLQTQIDESEAQLKQLTRSIPAEWAEAHEKFSRLIKEQRAARKKYQRTADAAFSPIVELVQTLESTPALAALGADIEGLPARIEAEDASAIVAPLTTLIKQLGAVKGAEKLKSGLNRARRDLRRKKPKKERAIKHAQRALAQYRTQLEWREKTSQSALPDLKQYLAELRTTIGIRQQSKMTKEQSLYVAACSAGHRDISLNF